MLTGNSGITTNASKAKTKSYLADIKEEYELYLSEKRMEDEYDLDTLYANDKTIRYEGNESWKWNNRNMQFNKKR